MTAMLRKFLPFVLLALACVAQPACAQSRIAESPKAPKVGEKAPEFTLPDTDGKPVALADLLKPAAPGNRSWVLLIFYRGWW
jgi:hypothetical protein